MSTCAPAPPAADCPRPIALFTASLGGGGAERATLHLAAAIAGAGWPVDLVLARARGPLLARVPVGVRVVDLRARRVGAALPGLARYLGRRRPGALLSALTHANLVALLAARLARAPAPVVVEHGIVDELARVSARRRDRWALAGVRRLYPVASRVIAVSHGVARAVGRVVPGLGPRIRVVPNPVVTPALWEEAAAPVAEAWFGAGEPPVVLAVGRLAPEKDLGTLLRAFREVRRRRRARLVVLGEGTERRRLEEAAGALELGDDVVFPGFEPSPYRYMARASVLALSSRLEGLPTVLIEALALGTPVVSTDCESGPRDILDGGRLGRLTPVGDARALAAGIEAALASARPAVPASAWAPYTDQATLSQYLDLLGVGSGARVG